MRELVLGVLMLTFMAAHAATALVISPGNGGAR